MTGQPRLRTAIVLLIWRENPSVAGDQRQPVTATRRLPDREMVIVHAR